MGTMLEAEAGIPTYVCSIVSDHVLVMVDSSEGDVLGG